MRKIILYIIYGEDKSYYEGAKFSLLTFMNWIDQNDSIEFVVLTEKPLEFSSYPVKTFLINEKKKYEWSIGGKYNFRIKNRGLAYIMDNLNLTEEDKILFFDADTYFHKSPLKLFELIKPHQALFYLNEGLIYKRKRFRVFVDNLEGKSIKIENQYYQLTKDSAMWGSLMVGIMPNMRPSLEWADKLMLEFYKMVPAHTIEPFSLSESLLKKYKIVEGSEFISLYSTSRKKEFASKVISNFFVESTELSIIEKINLAQKTKIKRPVFAVLKQRIIRLFNN